MSRKPKTSLKHLQWWLECLGHSLIEGVAGCLPGPWVFRMGEALGGLVWHFMPRRRKIILKNLRIAYAGTYGMDELRRMAKASFRRVGGNLMSVARTARLTPAKLSEVIQIDNLELLEQALAGGKGVVLLLSHMGNWEILSRLVHFFPSGVPTGAFYQPLSNRLLDERVLQRRQADGTRMFSKRDNLLNVTGFLRAGGMVGILADQRVGRQGEVVRFFGRLTRASPLPSLLARRAKSPVLALSVTTVAPGKWRAVFLPVAAPPTTTNCMVALEQAMAAGPVDVFWLQERWKLYIRKCQTVRDWLGQDSVGGSKPLRALLWLAGAPASWQLPDAWKHSDVTYEIALNSGQAPPAWLTESARLHTIAGGDDCAELEKAIAAIDGAAVLPLDFILAVGACPELVRAGRREMVPVISLP